VFAAAYATQLLEREVLLIEQASQLEVSHRRRTEIEGELAEINSLLKGLGLGSKRNGKSS